MTSLSDLTGQKFGRLTVVRQAESSGGRVRWFCLCDCGMETTVLWHRLKSGHIKSCGCLKRQGITKHGGYSFPEYMIWVAMKQRCLNPKSRHFRYYGGRGIAICKSWLEFSNFIADMGRRPTPAHSIERKDNDGDYEPNNCCWATQTAQMRNRRVRNDSSSKVAGVTFCRRDRRWVARISVLGKSIYLGEFHALADAIVARRQAEIRYWGEAEDSYSTELMRKLGG